MNDKAPQASVATAGPGMWRRWATPCLLLVILLGFGLRAARLDSLPSALSLDESVDGLDALQLMRTHWLTPFLQNYFGRETLFFYVQSLALALFGINQFSLRFASAIVGTLTIALTYIVSRRLRLDELVPTGSAPGWLIGLMAAASLAICYWHIYFSRVAQRAILLPPLLLCLVYCFWRGWQTAPRGTGLNHPPGRASRRRLCLAAAGALLGLSLYTYLAARMLPFLFGFFVIVELLRERAWWRARVVDSLLVAAPAALVSIPLLVYFVRNPLAFGGRADMVSILNQDDTAWALLANLLRILRIQLGGGSWLGHWPSLNALAGIGLLAGLFACLARIRRPAARFFLLWWTIGFLPVLLSQQEWDLVTTIQRGVVAWPAACMISALGLWAVFDVALRWTKHTRPGPAWFAMPIVLAVVFGMLQDARAYFVTWAQTYDDSSDDAGHVAAYLNSQTTQVTLTPSQFYANPMYNVLLQDHYRTVANIDADHLKSLLASETGDGVHAQKAIYLMPREKPSADKVLSFFLLVPSEHGGGTAYLLPPLSHGQVETLLAQTASVSPTATILNGRREEVTAAYPLSADAPFLPVQPIDVQPIEARFGEDIILDGYLVDPSTIETSEPVGLYLRFRARRWIDGDYALFVHLVDVATGQRWAQVDTALGGSTQLNVHRWPPGLIVLDLQQFHLPPDAPDGAYRFEVGIYQRPSTKRLPVALEGIETSGDAVALGKLLAARHPHRTPSYPLSAEFEDGIALVGLDLTQRGSREIALTLYWQALGPVAQDYTVFTHLVAEDGSLIAQQDNMPQGGRYRTSLWSTGETVADPYVLSLAEALPAGRYHLWVGLYRAETGQRLPLKASSQDRVELPILAKGDTVVVETGEHLNAAEEQRHTRSQKNDAPGLHPRGSQGASPPPSRTRAVSKRAGPRVSG